MFAWHSILYGILLSTVDVVMMSFVKNLSIMTSYSWWLILLPMIVYSFEPLIFLSAIKFESMAIMNLVWNLVSNILVTAVGVLYFGESITGVRLAGFILALISLLLLSYK